MLGTDLVKILLGFNLCEDLGFSSLLLIQENIAIHQGHLNYQ